MRRCLPKFEKPIYSCELDERVPALVEYPLADIVTEAKCAYLNNTVAYAIAFGIYQEVGHMDLYGMDFSYKHNLHFAEAGRACVEFWVCKAMENGISIGVSPRSSMLDQNVEIHERLYGYHRLSDPLVAMPDEEGTWLICPRSELRSNIKKFKLKTVELPSSPEPFKG